jgi:hypothetical protein
VIEVLAVARRCLHPNEDLLGERIQPREFVQQDVPSLLAIGEAERLDHQAFVWSTDTARTRLASDVNSTHILANLATEGLHILAVTMTDEESPAGQ